jgi:hypothetical protein
MATFRSQRSDLAPGHDGCGLQLQDHLPEMQHRAGQGVLRPQPINGCTKLDPWMLVDVGGFNMFQLK